MRLASDGVAGCSVVLGVGHLCSRRPSLEGLGATCVSIVLAPVTQALVEDGLIGSGHVVLDIATGPGEPALTIAALVGPEGKVLRIDPAPEMAQTSAG
jgi:hypothetical protein